MPKLSKAAKGAVVDCLGRAKARAAPFIEDAQELNERVASFGDGDYDGLRFRATVRTSDRKTVPQDAWIRQLNKLMGMQRALRWIRNNTTETPVTVVKVVARKVGGR